MGDGARFDNLKCVLVDAMVLFGDLCKNNLHLSSLHLELMG